MIRQILPFLFIMILFYSCSEKEEVLNAEESSGYLGHWVQVGYEDNIQVLKRTSELKKDQYAFSILSNGKFIENKNTSWCGTPPVAYDVYQGKWIPVSDNMLKVEAPYWGGPLIYNMEIVFVSDDTLKVKNHSVE